MRYSNLSTRKAGIFASSSTLTTPNFPSGTSNRREGVEESLGNVISLRSTTFPLRSCTCKSTSAPAFPSIFSIRIAVLLPMGAGARNVRFPTLVSVPFSKVGPNIRGPMVAQPPLARLFQKPNRLSPILRIVLGTNKIIFSISPGNSP